MRKRISKEEAGRILQDCEQDKVFWAKNGVTIKNLDELHIALKMIVIGLQKPRSYGRVLIVVGLINNY